MEGSQNAAPNRYPLGTKAERVACHELVLAVYRITSRWPSREQYGLTSQDGGPPTRSRVTVPRDRRNGGVGSSPLPHISLGSISELSYALLLARDLEYLKVEEWGENEASGITLAALRGVVSLARF